MMPQSRSIFVFVSLTILAALLTACGGPAQAAPEPAAPPPTSAPTTAPPTSTATPVPPTATPAGIPTEALPDFPRVTLEDAKAAYFDRSAVFVDVRSVRAYKAAHIPGAIYLSYATIEQHFDELDKQAWIITYCNCPHEEESVIAAWKLVQNGFTRANPLLGGYWAWTKANLPLEQ